MEGVEDPKEKPKENPKENLINQEELSKKIRNKRKKEDQ